MCFVFNTRPYNIVVDSEEGKKTSLLIFPFEHCPRRYAYTKTKDTVTNKNSVKNHHNRKQNAQSVSPSRRACGRPGFDSQGAASHLYGDLDENKRGDKESTLFVSTCFHLRAF